MSACPTRLKHEPPPGRRDSGDGKSMIRSFTNHRAGAKPPRQCFHTSRESPSHVDRQRKGTASWPKRVIVFTSSASRNHPPNARA